MRTSDWDMPNCRAMSLGLIPALNAARTALICPRVNESRRRFNLPPGGRFARSCRRLRGLIVDGPNLPRCPISSRVAAWSKSNSASLKCLTAVRRFFGSTCRCEDASAVGCVAGMGPIGDGVPSRTVSVENRSGVACSPRSRPMRGSCLHRCRQATSGRNAPAGGHAPSGVVGVAGQAAGCGCRTGAVKCLSGAATPTGLIALSPCPVLIGFGTRDKRRYGCQPAPRRRVSSPGGAQGNPCIEQGVKGFNGPPRATPHGPTVFAHGFRMASKASSLVEAGLTGADLTGCRIYGVSA